MMIKHLVASLCLGLAFVQAQAAQPLRVAVDPTFPPMEYVENGQHTGFDVQLIEALAAKLARPVEYVDMDFKGLVPSILAGRSDVVASAIYITPERLKVVDFTDSYYTGGLVIMVQAGNTALKTPEDLPGKRVAVQVGTKSVQVLKDRFPTAQLVEVEKNEQMFNSLETGRVDAVVTGKPAALLYAKNRASAQVLAQPVTAEEYGMAVSKDDPQLRQALNDALRALKEDGTYAKLVAQWFGSAAN